MFTIVNRTTPVADSVWATAWYVGIVINMVLAVPATIWFTVGGIMDIRDLYAHLKTAVRDASDDGRVEHEDEAPNVEEAVETPH